MSCWVKSSTSSSWKERVVQLEETKITITKAKEEAPVGVIELNQYNTVVEDEDPKRKQFFTLSNSDDETVEKWSIAAPKDTLDKWIASIKAKFSKGKDSPKLPAEKQSKKKSKSTGKKRKPDELDDDAKDSDSAKKLKSFYRKRIAALEKHKSEAVQNLQYKVEERAENIKIKVTDDLRRRAIDDPSLLPVFSTKLTALLTVLSDYVFTRSQYLNSLLLKRVRDIKELIGKVAGDDSSAAAVKFATDLHTNLEQELTAELKRADESFETTKKEKETEMSASAADLEKSGHKDKLPLFIEQHQLAMGAAKFVHEDTIGLVTDLLTALRADHTADLAFFEAWPKQK